MTPGYELLRSILSDKIIAFHPALARALGGINEALLFQQLAYWSNKGSTPDWIYKTQRELEDETTLTRTQQENARRTLRRLGVIDEEKRGLPAKLYFRVNWPVVFQLLKDAGNLQPSLREPSKDAGNLQARLPETDEQVRGFPADRIEAKPQTSKSTSENTEQRGEFESSKERLVIKINDRVTIGRYVEDLARELRDEAPLASSTTRACRIYLVAGLDLDAFVEAMLEARRRTQERSATIKKPAANGRLGEKAKMAYWFRVLEDLVGVTGLDATG